MPKKEKRQPTSNNKSNSEHIKPSATHETTSQNNNQQDDSITKASFLPEAAYKYVSGVRKPIGIRMDTGLKKSGKPVMQALFGSECKALEIYYSTLILLAKNPASICYTGNTKIDIAKIVIERNLRPRRKLEFSSDFAEEDVCLFCKGEGIVRKAKMSTI